MHVRRTLLKPIIKTEAMLCKLELILSQFVARNTSLCVAGDKVMVMVVMARLHTKYTTTRSLEAYGMRQCEASYHRESSITPGSFLLRLW